MTHKSVFIPVYEPLPIKVDADRSIYPSKPPMSVEAIDINHVKVSIEGVSCVVDGIALSNAVNETIHNYRRRRR